MCLLNMNRCFYCVVLFAFFCSVQSQRYIVPEATLEILSPRGLRISIPDDDPEIKLVAYHINVNKEFQGLEHGQYGVDIIRKKDGRWSYLIPDLRLRQGDVIYYWIHVIVDKLAYNGLDREYRVLQANPHGGPSPGTSPGSTPGTSAPPGPPTSCTPSKTTLGGGTIHRCPGEVVLDDHFRNLDGWKHQVTIGGDAAEDEFIVFTTDATNSWLEGGRIMIKPSLLEDKYNDSFVRSGELFLQGCTSYVATECVRRGQGFLILPPILSARLATKDKFSFRYGTVEIKAKLPQGDWIVPELWLEPLNGPSTERLVMGLSRGNTDDFEFGGQILEAGVTTETRADLGKRKQEVLWSRDFHVFKLHWAPEGVIFTVDGQEIHRITSQSAQILNKELYISLGVHVAGNRDFPETIRNKPWKNSDPKRFARFWDDKKNWFPTWNEGSALQVEYVKVTAL